jgi:hypothetical protein
VGELPTPRPGRLAPGQTRNPLKRRLGGHQCLSGRGRKNSPQPRCDVWSVQPVASRYTNCAISSEDRVELCLRVTGNLPRRTTIPLLHATFSIPLIRDQIHHMTARFFYTTSNHTNPLVRAIGNYTLTDLRQQYKKYIHKRTKPILL